MLFLLLLLQLLLLLLLLLLQLLPSVKVVHNMFSPLLGLLLILVLLQLLLPSHLLLIYILNVGFCYWQLLLWFLPLLLSITAIISCSVRCLLQFFLLWFFFAVFWACYKLFHRYVPEIITATRENKMCLTKKITFCFLWPNDDLWSGDADAGCFSGKKKLFNALKIAEYVFFSFCGVRSTHVHGHSNLPRCCGQHRFHLRRTLQLAHRDRVIINC